MTAWHCMRIIGPAPIVVCERETLQAEIERLQAAGDELLVCTFAGAGGERLIAARKAWKEARRG